MAETSGKELTPTDMNTMSSKTANGIDAIDGALGFSAAWDPMSCPDWDKRSVESWAIKRLQRDLQQLYKNPPHGIFAIPDESDITRVHILIVGPIDTPYQGGFFYFLLRIPPDYPLRPPRVRLMTTGGGMIRFNPNFYQTGKVCLSILGTWSGPSWAASLTLESVALSIQSLMNEKPYFNEPGYETERMVGDSDRYNDVIVYNSLLVAVCGMIEERHNESKYMPSALKEAMQSMFIEFYETYIQTCEKLIEKRLEGTSFADPFGVNRGKFSVDTLVERLKAIKTKYESI